MAASSSAHGLTTTPQSVDYVYDVGVYSDDNQERVPCMILAKTSIALTSLPVDLDETPELLVHLKGKRVLLCGIHYKVGDVRRISKICKSVAMLSMDKHLELVKTYAAVSGVNFVGQRTVTGVCGLAEKNSDMDYEKHLELGKVIQAVHADINECSKAHNSRRIRCGPSGTYEALFSIGTASEGNPDQHARPPDKTTWNADVRSRVIGAVNFHFWSAPEGACPKLFEVEKSAQQELLARELASDVQIGINMCPYVCGRTKLFFWTSSPDAVDLSFVTKRPYNGTHEGRTAQCTIRFSLNFALASVTLEELIRVSCPFPHIQP
jgi:hypothetical protein